MPFPTKMLHEDEQIVLDLRPHWWFFAGPVAWLVVAVSATVVAAAMDLPDALFYAALVVAGLTLVWLVGRLLRWTTTNFVVTTDRLVYRSGVLAKQGMEMPVERINDIRFNQTVLERIIGAGDLMIESGGERGQQLFTDIPRPSRVQHEIYRQIERAHDRAEARRAARRELSVPEQLEKLAELRDRGILTPAEFEAKKAQLLDKL